MQEFDFLLCRFVVKFISFGDDGNGDRPSWFCSQFLVLAWPVVKAQIQQTQIWKSETAHLFLVEQLKKYLNSPWFAQKDDGGFVGCKIQATVISAVITRPESLCHLICLHDPKYHVSCAHDAGDVLSEIKTGNERLTWLPAQGFVVLMPFREELSISSEVFRLQHMWTHTHTQFARGIIFTSQFNAVSLYLLGKPSGLTDQIYIFISPPYILDVDKLPFPVP